MKSLVLLSPFPFLVGAALADVPRKAPLSRYKELYMNSVFTSKPQEAGPVAGIDPFAGYSLLGVSPIGHDGYRVTMVRNDKPADRITFDSNEPDSEIKFLGIDRKAGDPLGTVVRLQSGGQVGTVGFNDKLLVIAAKPAAATKPEKNPPGISRSHPRPRVVPPAS